MSAMNATHRKRPDHVFHITTRDVFEHGRDESVFRAPSLTTEGFMHASTAAQVAKTARRLFHGRRDLILLCIDTRLVGPTIRYENLEGGDELFPHVYGPLNLDAVVDVVEFPPHADGSFGLPKRVADLA